MNTNPYAKPLPVLYPLDPVMSKERLAEMLLFPASPDDKRVKAAQKCLNISGREAEGAAVPENSGRVYLQRAVEADAEMTTAGSNPAVPTIQQPTLTEEEHNKFPRGRY